MTMPACEEGEGEWVDLEMKPEELRPQFTLTMGQCFNWRQKVCCDHYIPPRLLSGSFMWLVWGCGLGQEGSEDEWVGVVGSTVLAVKQTPDTTLIKCLAGSPPPSSTTTSALRDLAWDYFQLKVRMKMRAG